MTTAPAAQRPGTTYFVPGVSVRKLRPDLKPGPEVGEDLSVVLPDIIRVEVTRVNTGAAQYSITLNNWFDSLPADRHDERNTAARLEQLEDGRPRWPRFKYNGFRHLQFGDRLRIDMRYWPDPPVGLDAASASAQNWVPMVAGPITDMRFTFSAGEGARVTVSGEDDLSRLKDKHEGKAEFTRLSERSIVRKVLGSRLADYPLADIAPSRVSWPPFAEDDGRGLSATLRDGQSYLNFLQELADRLDFEVFVEFDRLDIPREGVAVALHFEPARSLLPPDRTLRDIFTLRREQHLIEFTPTIKVVDQYTATVVKGRHRDPHRPERVVQPADPVVVAEDMHIDPDLDRPLKSGPEIRKRYFNGRPNKAELANQPNLDPERAQQMAVAMLRKKAREFMTIEGTTIGLPRLRPGNHVEIRDFRPPFDGFYYVTKTVHTYGADGFRTRFSARRPGMPDPPYGEA